MSCARNNSGKGPTLNHQKLSQGTTKTGVFVLCFFLSGLTIVFLPVELQSTLVKAQVRILAVLSQR